MLRAARTKSARLTDSLDQRRLKIETGERRRLWQGRPASVVVERVDALALSCGACGQSPTVLTVYRTEAQAQTHCPKDAVVWLDAQSGLYYLKGHGSYGSSTAGRYACRDEADAAGMHGVPN